MLVNFNLERLDKLLYDFYCLTGLTVSIWDAELHQLSYQPKEMRGFCRLVKSSPEGAARCHASDILLCRECERKGSPATHYCHAGLVDTAIPIRFKDTVMGYMMFGQVTDEPGQIPAELLRKLAEELEVAPEGLLEEYRRVPQYDSERTSAAAAILKMATRYLWLSDYIEIGYHTDAARIDEYVHTHIDRPISVQDICAHFGISKNRLYALSHEWFGMPIGDYIISVRIAEAKRLLTLSDLSVGEVAAHVGIRDYNYFTKFFKENVGVPPLRYRKQSPPTE